jgi:hypothetical protein
MSYWYIRLYNINIILFFFIIKLGSYLDAETNLCTACHSTCFGCRGAGPNSCTECSGSFYLNVAIAACVTTCPSGYFANDKLHSCDSKKNKIFKKNKDKI